MSARAISSASAALLALNVLACSAPSGDPASSIETKASAIRPDNPRAPTSLPRFAANETVESVVSPAGGVRVHFTRAGTNAVPAADVDGSGVPDYVELVAATYDEVRALYHGPLALRMPVSDALLGGQDDGGDDRFDVYLVDFGGRADGQFTSEACSPDRPGECTGYMLQENDFAGYGYPSLRVATRILASHEYFHAVQDAYDSMQDPIFTEGTAVWATERFDPSLGDFEGFIGAYLDLPDRPLDVVSGGVVDAKSYGTAIFFQFLAEAYDPLAVPKLLAEVADGANGVADPDWFERLDPFLQREYGVTFAEAFARFATWNLYTAARADAAASYDQGAGYPLLKYENVTLPYRLSSSRFFPAATRYFSASPDGRSEVTAELVPNAADPGGLDGLLVFLTTVTRGRVSTPVAIADVTAGTETVPTASVDLVIAYVVNTNPSGNSRRPSLCLGTTDEVARCRDAALGIDAGVSEDAGASPDAEVVDASAVDGGLVDASTPDAGMTSVDLGDSSSCQSVGASVALLPLLLLGLGLVARHSRRRLTRQG